MQTSLMITDGVKNTSETQRNADPKVKMTLHPDEKSQTQQTEQTEQTEHAGEETSASCDMNEERFRDTWEEFEKGGNFFSNCSTPLGCILR